MALCWKKGTPIESNLPLSFFPVYFRASANNLIFGDTIFKRRVFPVLCVL